ncbi:hypothetical protein PV328_004894 [Microctonus aethiopoides]|uniref:UBA domain-containing protein n=1 Tax=Microctonus aethiopoides TaxID=144406 RepID=A0AA39FBR5_9HYME|nr:hypothetical protein PV328_004894 [Microctonus aethiopoides]
MIPWMREQIADAWHSRRGSRTTKKGSLGLSMNSGGIPDRKGDETIMSINASTSSDTFSVNVISLEGEIIDVLVKPDYTIEKLKSIATKHFYGSDSSKLPSNFHLVHPNKIKQLADENNLIDEEVNASDELIMVEVRSLAPKDNTIEESLRGPNIDAVIRATNHLPLPKPSKSPPSTDCPADFQAEIRKILITLVQTSAKILMHSTEGAKVYDIIKDKLELRFKPPNDPKTVKYLTDIGFSEKKVLKALRLRKMNVSEALEWLIEHQDDPDDDDEFERIFVDGGLINNDAPGPSSPSISVGSGAVRRKSIKETCLDMFKGSGRQSLKKEPNLVNVVALLLDSFYQYRRLEFRPNSRIKESLIEMGFDEKDVIETLKITGNNQSNACEWLLGARRKDLQDLDDGLDENGPIYSAIMANPHIQLSLTNPKMLLAYLSILETPSSTSIWINDPEVSPVLSQIFKTYHAEKHAIHMNRYSSSSDSS